MAQATDTTRGSVILFDDFLGDLVLDEYITTVDTGGTILPSGVDGQLKLLTDTTDNDTTQLATGLNWEVQNGQLIFEARVQIDVITTAGIFLGLSDATTETSPNMPFTLATTTFTSTATTAIGFIFDIDATTDNWHYNWVDDDADSSVAIATLNMGVAPVAATWETFRIVLTDQGSGNQAAAEFYRNGDLVAKHTSTIDRDALLTPYVGVSNRGAAAHILSLDYLFCAKTRAG
jgi:hypothetical protein